MSNIAILPMKSDSKRLPMKLFKEFCGKPLWQHVLDEVNKCPMIDEIYISTPDSWFIDYFQTHKRIKFIKRPKELAGDTELTEVMRHAAEEVADPGDTIIQIQLNKPLTKSADIMECIREFEEGKYDSLSTVQQLTTAMIGSDIKPVVSQAIVKIWKYSVLMQEASDDNPFCYGKKHCYKPIGKHHIEIDTLEDFKIAEALYNAKY